MDSTNVTNDGGVTKQILDEGNGDLPIQGKKVTVSYIGKFTDGKIFDQSDAKDPFVFTLGKGEVIKGWDVGVATMKLNERAVFTIKSDYAYGDKGYPGAIPGKATLIFEVKLLKFSK